MGAGLVGPGAGTGACPGSCGLWGGVGLPVWGLRWQQGRGDCVEGVGCRGLLYWEVGLDEGSLGGLSLRP